MSTLSVQSGGLSPLISFVASKGSSGERLYTSPFDTSVYQTYQQHNGQYYVILVNYDYDGAALFSSGSQ